MFKNEIDRAYKRYEELVNAAHRFACGFISWGKGEPGTIRLGGENQFFSKTGHWWLIDGNPFHELYGLIAESDMLTYMLEPKDSERLQVIQQAFRKVQQNIVLIGRGPVLPTFTPEERETELKRGSWYVIDGPAYEEFRSILTEEEDD